MSKLSGWEHVGFIGVDAGLCWVGDPCYVLHKGPDEKPKDIGKDWNEFCDKFYEEGADEDCRQFSYDPGHPGLGVCVSTGYGDGSYSVYVRRDSRGRVMQVMVDFEGFEGTDDGED